MNSCTDAQALQLTMWHKLYLTSSHVPTPAPGESVKAVEKQLQLSNIIDKQYFDTGAVAGLLLDTKVKTQTVHFLSFYDYSVPD